MAKHGGAPEREALVKEVLPRLLELAKNPYGHFLVSKLLALAPKPKLPGEQTHPIPYTHQPYRGLNQVYNSVSPGASVLYSRRSDRDSFAASCSVLASPTSSRAPFEI